MSFVASDHDCRHDGGPGGCSANDCAVAVALENGRCGARSAECSGEFGLITANKPDRSCGAHRLHDGACVGVSTLHPQTERIGAQGVESRAPSLRRLSGLPRPPCRRPRCEIFHSVWPDRQPRVPEPETASANAACLERRKSAWRGPANLAHEIARHHKTRTGRDVAGRVGTWRGQHGAARNSHRPSMVYSHSRTLLACAGLSSLNPA